VGATGAKNPEIVKSPHGQAKGAIRARVAAEWAFFTRFRLISARPVAIQAAPRP